MDLAFTHTPLVETKGRKERDALYNGDNFQRNTLPQTNENDNFSNQTAINSSFKIQDRLDTLKL